MTNDIESELLAMLSEPTVRRVERDMIRHDVLMRDIGRRLAPVVNALLADVADQIAARARVERTPPPPGDKADGT